MTSKELAETTAYCGLVCGLCKYAQAGECKAECREGGGDANCHQRKCCVEKGLAGCWECEAFPCGQGYFGDEAWKGLNIACVQCIKERGLGEFVGLLEAKLGRVIDYGAYRFRPAQDILTLVLGGNE